MEKNFIIIFLIIFILVCALMFITYKIKQNKVIDLSKEILSQIDYIKGKEENIKLIETLRDVNKLQILNGTSPRLYKTQDKIVAVLNDGTELEITLYTGDWSFSIEGIEGWHFRTECWLEEINLWKER